MNNIYLYLNKPEFIQRGQILKSQESSIRLLCDTDHIDHENREISYF